MDEVARCNPHAAAARLPAAVELPEPMFMARFSEWQKAAPRRPAALVNLTPCRGHWDGWGSVVLVAGRAAWAGKHFFHVTPGAPCCRVALLSRATVSGADAAASSPCAASESA